MWSHWAYPVLTMPYGPLDVIYVEARKTSPWSEEGRPAGSHILVTNPLH